MPVKRRRAANGGCQASTKSGTRCAAPAVKGTRLCSLHADPKRAAKIGAKGGKRNRKLYVGGSIPSLATILFRPVYAAKHKRLALRHQFQFDPLRSPVQVSNSKTTNLSAANRFQFRCGFGSASFPARLKHRAQRRQICF